MCVCVCDAHVFQSKLRGSTFPKHVCVLALSRSLSLSLSLSRSHAFLANRNVGPLAAHHRRLAGQPVQAKRRPAWQPPTAAGASPTAASRQPLVRQPPSANCCPLCSTMPSHVFYCTTWPQEAHPARPRTPYLRMVLGGRSVVRIRQLSGLEEIIGDREAGGAWEARCWDRFVSLMTHNDQRVVGDVYMLSPPPPGGGGWPRESC